eukprot:TRINITY_DN28687_c0_g7_i1.p1 TRINITY_DN28687_c0_g7~~TRINITY_DN28687_c0_g7_i1.p1  ORF type:complete len:267 (+),score=47.85 TRINITY_DN28687_c0_g7_i1:127-927(+)
MFEPGKWKCPRPKCQVVNWARRSQCFACGAMPKEGGWLDCDSSDEEAAGSKAKVAEEEPEEPWVCNFCGRENAMKDSHCFLCTSPSDEYLERIKFEKRRHMEQEKSMRNRSSRSVERDKQRVAEAERKLKFEREMNRDGKYRPCMPQRAGEARGARRPVPERERSRVDISVGLNSGSFSDQISPTKAVERDTDKIQWNSDEEDVDDFGRRKRGKAKSTEDAADASKGSGRLSAKQRQQAALQRLQNKASRRALSPNGRTASRSPRR